MSQDSAMQQPNLDSFKPKQGDLVKYEPLPHYDFLVVGAYTKMLEEGSLLTVIPRGSLSSLFLAIQPPSDVYFKVDSRGQIWFLGWYEHNQVMGPMLALWISEE